MGDSQNSRTSDSVRKLQDAFGMQIKDIPKLTSRPQNQEAVKKAQLSMQASLLGKRSVWSFKGPTSLSSTFQNPNQDISGFSPLQACSECAKLLSFRKPHVLRQGYSCTRYLSLLHKSARDRCPLCRCILQDFRPSVAGKLGSPVLERVHPYETDISMHVAVQGYKKASLVLRDIENPEGKPLFFTIARLSQSDNNPAKSLTQVCVSEKEVATDRTFGLVKGWIQDCDTTHQDCHGFSGPLPTRVIRLRKGAPPRLYVSQGESLPYICLSYCWGTKQPVVTTTATLGFHLQELPVDQLPKTIKDALYVTEKLGFEYLWIDALCIVQDSDDDKAAEVSKMHEIYQNSSLTICAARAETCLEGFLGPREMASVDSTIPFRLNYKATFQALDATVLLVEQNRTFKGEPMEPLHHRAWTMQETILSPRILLFSKYQLFFVCQEQAQQDGGIDDWNAYAEASRFHRLWGPRDSSKAPTKRAISDFELYFRPLASQDTNNLEEPSLQTTWERIMQDYSRRGISVPSDKLPALSSLATIFSQRTNLDYVAGMWKQWFPGALLWRLQKTVSISRPKEWRAPTWSWLSVDGLVIHCESLSQLSSSAGSIAEILECHVTPKMLSAPFGEISSAQLTIRTFGLGCFEVKDWSIGEQILYKKYDSDYPSNVGTAYLDLPMEDSPSDRPSRQVMMGGRLLQFIECMCVPLRMSINSKSVQGLIIEPVGGGIFRRVGAFESGYSQSDVFLEGSRAIFKLI